jgi:hypothetical protein
VAGRIAAGPVERGARRPHLGEVHALDSKHNFMRDGPEQLAGILLDVVRR